MTITKAPALTRDRPATERAILDAAKVVLAEQGFAAFGVNAIARQAKCDKQLIYRYFGGLDGLVDSIGKELSALFEDKLSGFSPEKSSTYADFIEHMVLSLLEAFRSSDLLLRIAAWEVLAPSPMTARLADARGRALAHWVSTQRGQLALPDNKDSGAINAVLIAATQHLALSAQAVESFGGVPLKQESDWERVRSVLRNFVRSAYASD